MRRGSLEYWPHRRAKRILPRVRSYPQTAEPSFVSIAAFKAGMTHIAMIDDTSSPSKGTEVIKPVTVLEMPKVFIYGIRFYSKGYVYDMTAGEAYDAGLAKNVGIQKSKSTLEELKKKAGECNDVTALAYLDPSGLGFGNKKRIRFEMPVGAGSVEEKIKFIEAHLGKDLKATDVLKQGEYVDISSISKGKGWAGVIKRFGVAKQYRKATNKVRHVGTLGPWHPAKVMFGVPHSGHMGFNYRTELNKRLVKIGTAAEIVGVNTKGGFLNYGNIKNDFLIIEGSVPGPAKRLVRIRKSIRKKQKEVKSPQINYISIASKQ